MTFEEIVDRAIAMLQRRQRVAYRTLKAQFDLDDDALEALKDELLYAQQVARDEDGRVLVWLSAPPGAPSPIESRTPEAERRQLTVLFCDLVESTPLAGRLDPEDLREVIRAYQAACAEVIQRFDGRVAQYLGDGLLVYFGYPQAHEDDAQRAIRAGREIIEAVGTLNTRLEHEKGVRLAVRVGIHTGLVVVGEIGTSGRQEQLALGETPNIAARLQGLALPDTVVISDATWRLVQGYFICRDLGVHHLKGVAMPIPLYQILGESGAQGRLDIASAKGLTPLVGRESEVTMLLERWGQAEDGLGQVVVLSGEAGIGKSRLVQVLKERLADGPHLAWECRCSPYHQHSALYPVVDLLQRTFHWHPQDTLDDKQEKLEQALRQYRLPLAETVPLLASLLSLPLPEGRYAPLALTPQRQKQKTMETIRALLLELAERQPVLVIVEDLHWVDPSTLEFLTLLVDQGPTARLLILLTCRPEFQSPWGSRAYLTPLALHRLPRSQVEVMVARVTGGKPLPPEVTDQIVMRTDGVPLFVEELIKTILESGWLQERADAYALTGPLPPLVIPATLHDALMARLDRLSTAKTVAQLGAAIGRTFAYDLLRIVASLDEATLQRDLGRLIDAELLYARGVPPQATYTFKHALIQEAAYQSLLKRTRQQYHQRIAQVLETGFGDVAATQPELLAHHLTEAGLIGQAMGYWQRAGQRAIERSAHVEAISHLTKGLAALKALPDDTERARQELGLLSILGLALVATKGQAHQDVERTYVRARELYLQMGETPQLFLAGLLSVYVVRAELQAAREVAEQLLSLAQRQHDTALLVAAQWALGHGLFLQGELVAARAHLEQAIALYDSQPHHARGFPSGFPGDLGVFSRCFAAHALWHLGYPDQSLQRMHEALVLAQELAHPYSRALALDYAAMLYQFRRDGHMVQESAETAVTLSKEQGFAYYLSWATIMQGWALAAQGQCEAGMARMHDGLAAMRATGAALRQPYYLGLLAEVCGQTDRAAAGLTLLAEAQAEADKTREHWTLAELHRLKGELLLHSGVGGSEAEQCFHQAIDIARRQQARSLELHAAMSLAQLWQRQGKRAEARELLTQIYGWFTEGFDTADLQEAAALLEALGSRALRSSSVIHSPRHDRVGPLPQRRVSARQLGEPSEVAGEGEDLVHPVLECEGHEARVVNEVAGHPAGLKHPVEDGEMAIGLAEDAHDGRSQEVQNCFQGFERGRGWLENAVMRHHAQELVQRRPEGRVRRGALAQPFEQHQGLLVVRGAAPVRVEQDVRVERDHPLSAVQQLEQPVPVSEIDPGQEAALNGLEPERVDRTLSRLAEGQPLAQRLVDDVLQGAVLLARASLRGPQNIFVERQGSSHEHHDASRGPAGRTFGLAAAASVFRADRDATSGVSLTSWMTALVAERRRRIGAPHRGGSAMIKLAGALTRLEAAVKERGSGAYVMTVSAEGRPHVTYAPVRWEGDGLAAEIGASTALNAKAKPLVTLLFPVRSAGDYSLIVDGSAAVEPGRQRLFLTPTRAVLHRPGSPSDPASSCGADCVPLFPAMVQPGSQTS